MKHKTNIIISSLVFVFCSALGFGVARNRPLWNDEVFTLISTIKGYSYPSIFLGQAFEGNANPLFYILQKFLCDIGQYQVPQVWIEGQWNIPDPHSQIFLRILPVFCMSLAITSIFFYFAKRYSYKAAFYSLGVSLSSYMIWSYFAEARPYALWVLLTSLQSVLFLHLLDEGRGDLDTFNYLVAVHFLLAFTVTLSLVQIVLVSIALWLLGTRRKWGHYTKLLFLPVIICLFYYWHSHKLNFWFLNTSMELLNANIPKDRLLILFIFLMYLVVSLLSNKKWPEGIRKNLIKDEALDLSLIYSLFTFLMILGCLFIMYILQLNVGEQRSAHAVSNRYFICLTPIGIIATTLFSILGLRALKGRILYFVTLFSLGGLLIFRMMRTYEIIQHKPF